MNLKVLISHPFTLIVSFLFVFTNGGHDNNFYFQQLITGLASRQIFSLTGWLGMMVVIFSYFKYKAHQNIDAYFVNLAGALLMIFSLFLFFYQAGSVYVSGTFEQIVPLCSLLVFCILVSFFVIVYPFNQGDVINNDLH